MKILVLGKSGQVASALAALAEQRGITLVVWGRNELNLMVSRDIYPAVMSSGVNAIINAAAYTAVDKAESEPETTLQLNAVAPALIAEAARDMGVPFVHISTDYVFSGDKREPYAEDDQVDPVSVYGRTKAEAERRILAIYSEATILRTAWVFYEHGGNFVKTMLRLGGERTELNVVGDQHGNPTYAGEIAVACFRIVDIALLDRKKTAGIFHFAGSGYTTWYGFAEAIFSEAQKKGCKVPERLVQISSIEYPTPARRPANSRFNCDKIQNLLGIDVPDWRVGLTQCIDRLIKSPNP